MKKLRAYIEGGSIYGKLMLLIGALILVPLIVIVFYPSEMKYAASFAIPALASIILGLAFCHTSNPQSQEIGWQSTAQRNSLPVLFAWCFGILAGAAPFVLSGQLSITSALFESVSGWTTTGLSLVNVEAMPHIILFHRSFMQYCGGLGFILMILLLVGSKHATGLYDAEGHPDRLKPSLKQTAKAIASIYVSFSVIGALLYTLFGMGLFDAVCHTMSALSTAGFSTQQNSIGQYASLPIEIITIVLMLIGSVNFAALLLLTEFKFKKLIKVSELRFMLGIMAVFIPLIAFSLSQAGLKTGESIRHSIFSIVSMFSTTGYATTDYASWPPFTIGLLIILMIIGGSVGSTAGGIKMARAYLILRVVISSIKKKISPSRRVNVQSYYKAQGKVPIDNTLIVDTFSFVFFYLLIMFAGTLLITISEGCTLDKALFEFASALGTVGVSSGITNASTGTATLVIEMIGMLLGRLEIYIVFIGINAGFVKIKNHFTK